MGWRQGHSFRLSHIYGTDKRSDELDNEPTSEKWMQIAPVWFRKQETCI